MTPLLKITSFLNELLKYDWERFNNLSYSKQNNQIHQIKDEFDNIIRDNSKNLDIKKANDILESYIENFEEIAIYGKDKYVFMRSMINGKGGGAIIWKLLNSLKNLEYEEIKKSSNETCDCSIALNFNKRPTTDTIKNIGWIDDKYYFPDVYDCNVCNFRWITYNLDDDTGRTVWEKYSESDDSFLVLH